MQNSVFFHVGGVFNPDFITLWTQKQYHPQIIPFLHDYVALFLGWVEFVKPIGGI